MYFEQTNDIETLPVQNKKCNLVGVTGLLVQILLGLLAFGALLIKRLREQQPRPTEIWFLDTTKQLLSALLGHLYNVVFSMFIQGSNSNRANKQQQAQADKYDECDIYLVTIIFDTFIGVFVSIQIMNLVGQILIQYELEELQSGNYYTETQIREIYPETDIAGNQMNIPVQTSLIIEINYLAWFQQLGMWLLISAFSQMLVFVIQGFFSQYLTLVSWFILQWCDPYPTVKLILVMICVPTITNGIQFWILDNFLKQGKFSKDNEEIQDGNIEIERPNQNSHNSRNNSVVAGSNLMNNEELSNISRRDVDSKSANVQHSGEQASLNQENVIADNQAHKENNDQKNEKEINLQKN